MTDREALAAALELLYESNPDEQGRNTTPVRYPLDVIGVAARERLAQLPEKCGTCDGDGFAHSRKPLGGLEYGTCPTCHGSGKVYPAELVERIAEITDLWSDAVIAVLDALNGTADG